MKWNQDRYNSTLNYAARVHGDQRILGTTLPYVARYNIGVGLMIGTAFMIFSPGYWLKQTRSDFDSSGSTR